MKTTGRRKQKKRPPSSAPAAPSSGDRLHIFSFDRGVNLRYHPEPLCQSAALIHGGLSDYDVIADAAGVSRRDVENIDQATDPYVRKLAVRGLHDGLICRLRKTINCPKCGAEMQESDMEGILVD